MKARYIPQDAYLAKNENKVEVYFYLNSMNKPCALGFYGKGAKPWFNYQYQNEEKRNESVQWHLEAARNAEARKLADKEAQKKRAADFRESLKPGMILMASWGWEQTNVNFYKVLERKGFLVTLQEVGTRQVGEAMSWASCMVAVDQASPVGSPFTMKLSPLSTSLRVNSSITATPWDGKPTYCSWYA